MSILSKVRAETESSSTQPVYLYYTFIYKIFEFISATVVEIRIGK